jgi:hypothetical protein
LVVSESDTVVLVARAGIWAAWPALTWPSAADMPGGRRGRAGSANGH